MAIVGVSIALLGAFSWILPSASERAKARFRMEALQKGVKVRRPDASWLDEHKVPKDDVRRHAIFYEKLLPPNDTSSESLVVCRMKGEEWCSDRESAVLQYQDKLNQLPSGVSFFVLTPVSASLLYDESGDATDLNAVLDFLTLLVNAGKKII